MPKQRLLLALDLDAEDDGDAQRQLDALREGMAGDAIRDREMSLFRMTVRDLFEAVDVAGSTTNLTGDSSIDTIPVFTPGSRFVQ